MELDRWTWPSRPSVTFRDFQDALLRAAELTPLSYEIYATLALYSTKLDMLWQLYLGLIRYGNWRTKAIFIWVFISTVYLALFPRFVTPNSTKLQLDSRALNLIDVYSGFDTLYTASIQWPNGTTQSTDNLSDGQWESNAAIVNVSSLVCSWDYGNGGYPSNEVNVTCCNSRWHYDNTTTYGSSDSYRFSSSGGYNITYLYYWTDIVLNESWWNHYVSDPGT